MKRISPLAFIFLLLVACGDDDPSGPPDDGGNNNNPEAQATAPGTPNGAATQAVIGAAGGTLASDDGSFSIDIPAGALSQDETIIIQPITNTAWGGVGNGYRLEPDGLTFAIPVELAFDVAPETLVGGATEFRKVVVQDDEGFWYVLNNSTYDEGEGTLTAQTTHFSDYSEFEGLQIRPGSASVSTSGTVNLNVRYCHSTAGGDEELVSLVYSCDEELAPLIELSSWSVNGITGGDNTVGTVVTLGGGDMSVRYTAPASVPQNNPVAVSVETTVAGTPTTLVCNITIGSKWYGTATVDYGGEKVEAYVVWKSSYTYQNLEMFVPESGTVTYSPDTHFDPPCWFVSFGPSTAPILTDDGQLFIDHTTSPGKFYGTGNSGLLATFCFSCDGWDEPDCQESLYFLTWLAAIEEDGWELDDENTISHAWVDLTGSEPVGYAIEFTRGAPPAPLRAFASK